MSDDFDEMAGMPPCPACSESASGFCAKHSNPVMRGLADAKRTVELIARQRSTAAEGEYHSKSEMRRLEAQKPDISQNSANCDVSQDPLEAAPAMTIWNGVGEHSVLELEHMVAERTAIIYQLKLQMQKPQPSARPTMSVEDETRKYADDLHTLNCHAQVWQFAHRDYLAGHASGRRSCDAHLELFEESIRHSFKEREDKLTAERDNFERFADEMQKQRDDITAERDGEIVEFRNRLELESRHRRHYEEKWQQLTGLRNFWKNRAGRRAKKIRGLTAELAEARAERDVWKKSAQTEMWRENIRCEDVEKERNTLQSQLTQAQADVAELVVLLQEWYDDEYDGPELLTRTGEALARMKGRS